MLHVDQAWLGELGLRADGPVRVVDEPGRYAAFCALNEMLFADADVREKEERLITVLGEIFTAPAHLIACPARPSADAELVASITERLRASSMRVSLGDLARDTGLSRYQLVRRFRRVTGFPPIAWQINERIIKARHRLREGHNLADVAGELGFADQSHFHRVFKNHTGVTPGEYRIIR